jgi:hypothetical protein
MALLEKAIVQELKDDPTLSGILTYQDSTDILRSVKLSGAAGTRIDAPWGLNVRTSDWSMTMIVTLDTILKMISPLDDTVFVSQQDGVGVGRSIMACQIQFGGAYTGFTKYGSFLNGLARNSTVDLSINTWYWLGITYNVATQTLRLYVNGQPVGTYTSVLPESVTGNFRIGSHKSGNPNLLRGKIAQFRVWSTTVTPADMLAWYTAHTRPTGTLELEWLFTDRTGTTITDTSGNGRHGTMVGAGATWSDATPFGRKHIYKGNVPDAALQTASEAYLVYNRVATQLNSQFGFMITTMQFSIFAPRYDDAIVVRDQLLALFHRFNMGYLGYGSNIQEVKHAWVTGMRDMRDPETKLHMITLDCDFKHVE